MLTTFLGFRFNFFHSSPPNYLKRIEEIHSNMIYLPIPTPDFTGHYTNIKFRDFYEQNQSSQVGYSAGENPSFVYPVAYGIITYIFVCLIHGKSDASIVENSAEEDSSQVNAHSFTSINESQFEIFSQTNDPKINMKNLKETWSDIISDEELQEYSFLNSKDAIGSIGSEVVIKDTTKCIQDCSTIQSKSIFSEDNWY